jgi:hypothetical protein
MVPDVPKPRHPRGPEGRGVMGSRFLDEQARRLPGCTHHPDAPHRPYCPCVLDVAEIEAASRNASPQVTPAAGDPLEEAPGLDTYDPDDRLPMGGDPYWSEDR